MDATDMMAPMTKHLIPMNCAVYGEGARDRTLLVHLDNLFGHRVYAYRWDRWVQDAVRPGVARRAIKAALRGEGQVQS